eukprot:COSAG05_NODE_1769_length_4114_cov_2.830137_2_plen_179_part_00
MGAPGGLRVRAHPPQELHERIEKRESMVKMGMENVADSLIPGFDKLEEKFIELLQAMKVLVSDFEPIAAKAALAATAEEGNVDASSTEIRARIAGEVAEVEQLTADLEHAAAMLEGKIESEEGKWQQQRGGGGAAAPAVAQWPAGGAAVAAEVSARPATAPAATPVDAIVADLQTAQD